MNKRGFGIIIAFLAVFLVNSVSSLTVSLTEPSDNFIDNDGTIDNLKWSATNTSDEYIDRWTLYFVETYSSQKTSDPLVANFTSDSSVELFNNSNNEWSISDFQNFSLSYEGDSYVHWAVDICNNNSECIRSDTRTILNKHTVPVVSIRNVSYSTNNVAVTYNISDYTISNCSLIVNDNVNKTTADYFSFSFNTDLTLDNLLSNGNYVLRIDCTDKVGLTGNSANTEITVSCSESWSCDDWDSCESDDKQDCEGWEDANSCGTTASRPSSQERDCDYDDDDSSTSTSSSSTSSSSSSSVQDVESSATFSGDAGDEKKYTFGGDVGLTGVEITLKTAVAGGKIDVEKVSESGVSAPDGTVYTYIKVDKTDITDDDIDEVLLKFKVEKTWVNEHIGEVILKRYNNGWENLPTLESEEDSSYIYYEAISPGFSVFAITISGEEKILTSIVENKTGNETKKGLITGFFGKDTGALTGWVKDVNKYVWIAGIPFVVLLIVSVVYRDRIFSRTSKEEREFDRHLKERAKLKEKEDRDREKRLKLEQEIREEKEKLEKKDLDGAMNRAFNDKKGIFSRIKGKEVKEEVPKADKVEIVKEEKKRLFTGFLKGYKDRKEEREKQFEFKDFK